MWTRMGVLLVCSALALHCKGRSHSEIKTVVKHNDNWISRDTTDLIDILPFLYEGKQYFCSYYKQADATFQLKLTEDTFANAKAIWGEYVRGGETAGPFAQGELQEMFNENPDLNNFYDFRFWTRTASWTGGLVGGVWLVAVVVGGPVVGGAVFIATVVGVPVGAHFYYAEKHAEKAVVADKYTPASYDFERRLKERAEAQKAANWHSAIFSPTQTIEAGKLDVEKLFGIIQKRPVVQGKGVKCPAPGDVLAELNGDGSNGLLENARDFKWVVNKGVKLTCEGQTRYLVKKIKDASMISVLNKDGSVVSEFDIEHWRRFLKQKDQPVGKLTTERNAVIEAQKQGKKRDMARLETLKAEVEIIYQAVGDTLSIDGENRVLAIGASSVSEATCKFLKIPPVELQKAIDNPILPILDPTR